MKTAEIFPIEHNVWLLDEETKEIVGSTHNVVTEYHKQQYRELLLGNSVTAPNFVAIGAEVVESDESPDELTDLKAEFERVQISAKLGINPTTARCLATFGVGSAVGTWAELGLFEGPGDYDTVTIHACDASANWSQAAPFTLSVNTTDMREGAGCLESESDGSAAGSYDTFIGTNMTANCTGLATPYVQFWYYSSDVSVAGDVTVTATTASGDSTYTWDDADMEDGWNWFSQPWSEFAGAADMETENITGFKLTCASQPANGDVFRIDKIRGFSTSGLLWARAEPSTTVTKSYNQIIAAYWFLAMKEGVTDMSYQTFASETLAIGAASTGLTASVYAPTGASSARQATILVTDAPVRWFSSGSAPTSTTGMLAPEMSVITLDNATDIAAFRAIKDASAQQNATLTVQYER
uniref:Uncharacterized protein n=1 Tax=viral metagenome TaxID=1070528 RepID=A0A6M3IE35_9ZZZZ